MLSLSEKQRKFTKCVSELINYATARGIEVTFGDAYRDERAFGIFGTRKLYSAAKSVHKLRLAIDLNCWVDDEYISDGSHECYQILGEFWKGIHPCASWGGDFGDANHFSFEHWGCK